MTRNVWEWEDPHRAEGPTNRHPRQDPPFHTTRQAPEGLGLKKLFSAESMGAVCEARVTLSRRVLFSVQQDVLTFLMVGDHDEVRQLIRTFQ